MIRSSFTEFKVLFSPRTCNRIAHAVGAFGCKCPEGSPMHWECTPERFEDLVASDSAESIS
jgi:hypothetical protein